MTWTMSLTTKQKIFKAPYHHEESEGGEAYQRMAHHLRKSDGGIHTNNEALSNLLLRRHEALQTPYHGQFQGGSPETLIRRGFSGRLPWVASGFPYTRRSIAFPVPTPFETPIQSDFSGQVPWVASTLPHIWRSNTYPDQETMNQAQRPMFFGPGVEPTNLVGPSTYTPWTSMYPTSWRPAGSFAWQGPWNERAARAWNNTAAAGFIPRGRLPYPNPPFEHRQTDGFARNANHTPFRAPFFIGSHSSSRFATATYDGFTVPIQGPNLHVDDTNAGEIDGLDTIPAPILADGSDEQYQYFPERGARSRSSPRRSRSQLRSPVRNKRPQSSPPQRLSQSEAENLPQATLE